MKKEHDVVYGVRVSRKENFLINNSRKVFYWLINKLSENDIPRNAGDFRLVSRKVINEIAKINDPQPYIRGAIASMGLIKLESNTIEMPELKVKVNSI